MADVQRQDPFAGQLRGEQPGQGFAVRRVGHGPVPGLGVELDLDLFARVGFAQAAAAVVQPDRAVAIGAAVPRPAREEGIDAAQLPEVRLGLDRVGAEDAGQLRVGSQPGPAVPGRVQLALHPAGPGQAILQGRVVGTVADLDPSLGHAVVPFDLGIEPGLSRGVPVGDDPQPDQPQRQVGGQIAGRAPGVAVVDPEAFGEPPAGEDAAEQLAGLGGRELLPLL